MTSLQSLCCYSYIVMMTLMLGLLLLSTSLSTGSIIFYGAIVSPIIIVLITHTMVLYESRSDTTNTFDSTDPFDIDADCFQIEQQHIFICFTHPRARLLAKFYLR